MKNIFEIFSILFSNPKIFLYKTITKFNRFFLRKTTINGNMYYVYKGHFYPQYLNRGNAVSFIEREALKYCHGKGIDVGAGRWPLKSAFPIRDEKDVNAYKLDIFKDNSLDYVFSSHCIEHLERWKEALCLWIRKLRSGGVIFIYAPHKSMLLWRPLAPWVGLEHKWVPEKEILESFISSCGCNIIYSISEPDIYWSFYIIAVKR